SEFVDEIAMRLLLRHDWKVGYFSPENTPLAYHYRKLIRRVVGKRFEHKGMPLPEAGQAIRYLAQSVFSIMPKED
ncbi:DNA primase, partial [Eubacterium callanderi]|nr:DNA primase [Eubacterium callanderi]